MAPAQSGYEMLEAAIREAKEEDERWYLLQGQKNQLRQETSTASINSVQAERGRRQANPGDTIMYACEHHSFWRDRGDWGHVQKGWLQDLRLPPALATRTSLQREISSPKHPRTPRASAAPTEANPGSGAAAPPPTSQRTPASGTDSGVPVAAPTRGASGSLSAARPLHSIVAGSYIQNWDKPSRKQGARSPASIEASWRQLRQHRCRASLEPGLTRPH
jgi:hypothetical protein